MNKKAAKALWFILLLASIALVTMMGLDPLWGLHWTKESGELAMLIGVIIITPLKFVIGAIMLQWLWTGYKNLFRNKAE